MRVLLFGASGMVGQSVLRESYLDGQVSEIISVGRSRLAETPVGRWAAKQPEFAAKLREVPLADIFALPEVASELGAFDAVLYCLGISSVGVSQEAYHRLTHGLTMVVAQCVFGLQPQATFGFISAAGSDHTLQSRQAWARSKGMAERDLFAMGFPAVYSFRPPAILPVHGIRSKTAVYQLTYDLFGFALPWVRRWAPAYVITTEEIGRAYLAAAKEGMEAAGQGRKIRRLLETADIVEMARRG